MIQLEVECRFNHYWENPGSLPLHHLLPHPDLYQRSAYLYFNGTLPTFTITFIEHLQQMVY